MKKLVITLLLIVAAFLGFSQTSPTYENITIRNKVRLLGENIYMPALDSASTAWGLYWNKTTGKISYDSAGTGGSIYIRISGDTLFAGADTLVISGVNYWTQTGDDIENNNIGTTTVNGEFYLPDSTTNLRLGFGLGWEHTTGKAFVYRLGDLRDTLSRDAAAAPSVFDTWIRNSAGNELYPATLTDSVGIGISTPTQKLDVRGRSYFLNTSRITSGEPFFYESQLDTLYGNTYNIRSLMDLTITDSTIHRGGALTGQTNIQDESSAYLGEVAGTYGVITSYTPYKINQAKGAMGIVENRAAGTINNAYGLYSEINNESTGTITNAYGAYIRGFTNASGTLTNAYGLFLGEQTTATNVYGVYQVGAAKNYFGGTIDLPTTTATVGMITKNAIPWIHNFGSNGNLFVGRAGNFTLSDARNDIGIGDSTLIGLTDGDFNIGLGLNAGRGITSGGFNITIGSNALKTISTTSYNIAIGGGALQIATGTGNVAIGYNAGNLQASGDNSTFVGHLAGRYSTGANNTALGLAATALTSGTANIMIGNEAGSAITTTSGNTIIGYRAGLTTTSTGSTVLGMEALRYPTAAATAIGYQAGYGKSSGTINADGCTFVGSQAGFQIGSGQDNTAIGRQSMYGTTATVTGNENTTLGYRGLYGITSATQNVAVGSESGYSVTTGGYNTLIGGDAGRAITTGASNVLLGYSAGKYVTGSNKLIIDNADNTNYAGDTTLSLIFGNFATNRLTINGDLKVTGLDSASTSYGVYYDKTTGLMTYDSAGSGTAGVNYWEANADTISNNNAGGIKIYADDGSATSQLRMQIGNDDANDEASVKIFNLQNSQTLSYEYTGAVVYNPTSGDLSYLPYDTIGGGSGTVTSIATTSPLTGGTITTTGTIAIHSDTLAAWRTGFTKANTALQSLPASAVEWSDTTATGAVGIATFDAVRDSAAAIRADFPAAGLANVVEDTSPQLGANLDLNEFNVSHDEAPTANLTTSGNVITLTAGAALAFGDVCYMGSDGKMEKGDADGVATAFCWTMALATISEDAAGLFALPGTIVRNDSWNWTSVGQPVYLDTATAGGMTQTMPTGTDDVIQIIGIATHADRIFFYPQLVQIELN